MSHLNALRDATGPVTASVIGFAAVLVLQAPALATETFRFEGKAYDTADNLIYREFHEVTGECRDGAWRPQEQTVAYKDAGNNETFATKTLRYSGSLLRPGVDFRQPQHQETLSITPAGEDTVDIEWQQGENSPSTWTVDTEDSLVADTGFDHFVRQNWSALTAGDSVSFRFLAPTRGEHYGFVAEPATNREIRADHVFRIRPSGLMLRLLVDPIYLGYNDSGFLSHYSGLGNIRENADQNYTVTILYQGDNNPGCPLLP